MDVFVFGSNEAGIHGKGAALTAKQRYGAVDRKAFGLQDRSFAIPTKDRRFNTLHLIKILPYVRQFIDYARKHPEDKFHVTPIGTGEAKFPKDMIAPLFVDSPENLVFLDEEFASFIPKPTMERRLLVAGSKELGGDSKEVFEAIDKVSTFLPSKGIEVIPFTESLAGRLAMGWAKRNNIPTQAFKAKWDRIDLPTAKVETSDRGPYNKLAMIDRQAHAMAFATDLLIIRDKIDRDTTGILQTAASLPLKNVWTISL